MISARPLILWMQLPALLGASCIALSTLGCQPEAESPRPAQQQASDSVHIVTFTPLEPAALDSIIPASLAEYLKEQVARSDTHLISVDFSLADSVLAPGEPLTFSARLTNRSGRTIDYPHGYPPVARTEGYEYGSGTELWPHPPGELLAVETGGATKEDLEEHRENLKTRPLRPGASMKAKTGTVKVNLALGRYLIRIGSGISEGMSPEERQAWDTLSHPERLAISENLLSASVTEVNILNIQKRAQ